MGFTHRFNATYQAGNEAAIGSVVEVTGESEANLSGISVAAASPDTQVILGLRAAGLKTLYILSDKDLTVETNDGTTPDDTISVKANVPYLWSLASGVTCPITVDVVDVFLTNTGTGTATVHIRALQDATP